MGEIDYGPDSEAQRLYDEQKDAPPLPTELVERIVRKVVDQNLERDRTFGDDLMGFLERRKKRNKATKFMRPWRNS